MSKTEVPACFVGPHCIFTLRYGTVHFDIFLTPSLSSSLTLMFIVLLYPARAARSLAYSTCCIVHVPYEPYEWFACVRGRECASATASYSERQWATSTGVEPSHRRCRAQSSSLRTLRTVAVRRRTAVCCLLITC